MRTLRPLLVVAAGAAAALPLQSALGQDATPVDRDAFRFVPRSVERPYLSREIDAIDGILGSAGTAVARGASRSHDPTLGNPNPWASLIGPDDFHEGFEHYTPHTSLATSVDWFELAGQTAPNGNVWQSAADYNGVVNNAIAQTGPNWNPGGTGYDRQGVVGGPDPNGDRSQFFASPRGTIEPQAYLEGGFFAGRLRHDYYAPTVDEPVITVMDYYLDDLTTFVWWRPVSFLEGGIVTNVFLGGIDYSYYCPFFGGCPSVSDRVIVLGPKVGGQNEGDFFVAPEPHRIAEREWLQVAVRQGVDSFSVWVRDATTIGVNGFAQDSIYDAFPGDPTRGAFAGEVLADGWLQIFPGVADDPNTPVVEGYGRAENLLAQDAELITDATGSPAGRRLFTAGVDGVQLITGNDPPLTFEPAFQPHDWYADNYTVFGPKFTPSEPPPFCLPFLDDFESWTPGPINIQSNQLFGAATSSIATDQNNTAAGAQAARSEITYADGFVVESLRRDVPAAEPTVGDAVDVSLFVRMSGPRAARGVFADDNTLTNGHAFRIVLGATDGAGVVDDRVYARLPNPNFDPGEVEALVPGQTDQHSAGANARFVNVPLVDDLGQPITTALDQWFEVRAVIEPPFDAPGSLRVFIDGVEAFADGSVEGVAALAAPTGTFDQLEIWTETTDSALGSVFWLDDISILGPALLVPTTLTVDDAPFTTHPAFSLPYTDDLSTYRDGRALGGQGATPWLGALFTGTNARLSVVPLEAGATVDPSTLGYYYTVDTVLDGTPPGGATAGSTVFVVDNIADALAPNPQPIPGSTPGPSQQATRVDFRDADCAPFASAEWRLQNQSAQAWDGSTPVVGRYWLRYLARFAGEPGAERLVIDSANFPANGEVLALESVRADSAAVFGGLDQVFLSQLPEARPAPGETAVLEFDLWVGIDDPLVGPRGRLAWRIFGPGAQPGEITTLVFGGPHNYTDANTFNEQTGTATPGPDGLPDNYYRGGSVTVGGAPTYADPTLLYVARDNPDGGFGKPDTLLEETAYTVPGNAWIRCIAEVEHDGSWMVTLDDGVSAPFVLTGGAPIPSQGDVQGTDGLDLWLGFDPGANGEPAPGPITWRGLGATAPPEGGFAPLPLGAGGNVNGSFNEVANPNYFYFEIFTIDPGATNLPQVMEVDPAFGGAFFSRDLQQGDIVALWNDQGTAAFGGASGAPFLDQIATNRRFQISPDGATINARGEWIPLGLPGLDGVNDPAPLGGIVNFSPPYTDFIPFSTILFGSIADFPDLGPAPAPAAWFVDNISLDLRGCLGDLSGDGVIDGSDLGLLLGDWGAAGSPADLNNSGGVDGADLGLLLGLWGPCP
jgi:hypothetical protein